MIEEAGTAPGDESDREGFSEGLGSYALGFALASLLTIVSFALPSLNLVWAPSLPVALAVLAIAQMGVHLVFFLHLTTGPDNVNNVLALAFGVRAERQSLEDISDVAFIDKAVQHRL